MKQRLGDDSSIEVWKDEDAGSILLAANGLGDPEAYALALIDHRYVQKIALNEDEASILKMTLLLQSDELKRELLRFVHFIESVGILPAQQAALNSELRGKLVQHYQSFEQLVDLFIDADHMDWGKMAQDNE